jgi:uncharacterized protein YbaP (TraB family)
MNPRRAKTTRRRLATALVLACIARPALADDAPAAAEPPPVCVGRDLSLEAALHPDALAQAEASRRDQLDNAQGLLWRVEKPPAAPSFLFGTIHSTDDRAIAIARTAAAHIAGAKVVATELGGPFNALTTAAMGATMLAKALARDDDTLKGIGAPADVALIENYVGSRGLGAAMAHHLRLWFLAALTASPPCELQRQRRGLPVVDELIAKTAKDAGVKVVGLETIAEQTEILSSIDPTAAATLLVGAARKPALNDDAYMTLLALYAEGRPAEVLPVFDATALMTPEEAAADDEMTRHVLGARNRIMAERMAPLLDAGGAFVAVGALHLPGKGGLIALLRAAGFTVTVQ